MSVLIYSPIKNPMQSGKGKSGLWVVEQVEENTRFIDPMMGWTGNSDTDRQVKLRFSSKEEAVAYAERKKLDYTVKEPKKSTVKIQTYSDNFSG